jgi:LmbE family N-acetylglucosaminyl deacetylase
VETLCVLAHQDDELAMGCRILEVVRRGGRVRCIYLTDGSGWGVEPSRRDEESRTVLAALGVADEDIHFVGEDDRVADGRLVTALDSIWERLSALTRSWTVDELLCPAYEGGHMDHDAANVVAIALRQQLAVTAEVRQFPFYNGWGTRGAFFRVMHPSPGMGPPESRPVTAADGLKVTALARHFRSQRRTWLGLTPETFVKLVLMRREYSSPARADAVLARPHHGPLLYERRFGVSYDDWRRAADHFIGEHPPWQIEG